MSASTCRPCGGWPTRATISTSAGTADGALYGAYGDGWGLPAPAQPPAGDRREPGHRHTAQLTGREVGKAARRVGASLLGGVERQVVGDALPPAKYSTCGSRRWSLRALGSGGADRDLPRRRPDLAQGGLGVHPDRMLMPSFLQIGKAHRAAALPAAVPRSCLQLPQPARGLARRGADAGPDRPDPRAAPSRGRAWRLPLLRRHRGGRRAALGQPDRPAAAGAGEGAVLDTPPAVTWNPSLGRFIMVMPHVPRADPTRAASPSTRRAGRGGRGAGSRLITASPKVRLLLPAAGQVAAAGSVGMAGLLGRRRARRPGMGLAEHRQGAVRAGATARAAAAMRRRSVSSGFGRSTASNIKYKF